MMIAVIAVCVMTQVLDVAPAPTARQTPPPLFEVVDSKGQTTQGSIVSLAKGELRLSDVRGSLRTLDLASIVSISRVGPVRTTTLAPRNADSEAQSDVPPRRVWAIELTDGQRFAGTLSQPVTDESCVLQLEGEISRSLTLPLERISMLALREAAIQGGRLSAPSSGGSSQDILTLANGDTLGGFVAALGPVVKIETAPGSGTTAAQVQEIALDRVVAARLTNPRVPARGALIGYVDGRVIAAQSFTTVESQTSLVAALQPTLTFSEPLSAIAWVLPEASRWRPLDASASGPAGAVLASPLGITLTEPGTFIWSVRPGEERLVGVLSLPANSLDWGDFTLVIRVNQPSTRDAATLRFDAETPAHSINIDLAGSSSVEFVINPGPSGPIQDRLLISRGGFIAPASKEPTRQ